MQYLFQGWNTRGNGKYKDLILDTGSEEIGHVEMIATMIAQLLDDAPVDPQENAFESDPAIAAVMGGMDLQHAIVTGLGPTAKDSNGGTFIYKDEPEVLGEKPVLKPAQPSLHNTVDKDIKK